MLMMLDGIMHVPVVLQDNCRLGEVLKLSE